MVKLFGEWKTSDIQVRDPGLRKYINLEDVYFPKNYGRQIEKRFGSEDIHLVERLINKVMVPGHRGGKHWFTSGRNVGKASKAYKIVKGALERIEDKLGKNPVKVLVRAIENTSPREGTTVVEYGGIRHPKSVDISPKRRLDIALRWLVQGGFSRSVKSETSAAQGLTEEIIAAYNNSRQSYAITKKISTEREAAASR